MVDTTYNSTEDMVDKLQMLKGKTKLKFHKNISYYYDEMNIRNFEFEEDIFSKNSEDISKIYHELLLLMKFLQTKFHIKNTKINYHDLYYTVKKNRDEKQNVIDKADENEYIIFIDIIPNHYVGIEPRETNLR